MRHQVKHAALVLTTVSFIKYNMAEKVVLFDNLIRVMEIYKYLYNDPERYYYIITLVFCIYKKCFNFVPVLKYNKLYLQLFNKHIF